MCAQDDAFAVPEVPSLVGGLTLLHFSWGCGPKTETLREVHLQCRMPKSVAEGDAQGRVYGQ